MSFIKVSDIIANIIFIVGSILFFYCLWLLWARWLYRSNQKNKELWNFLHYELFFATYV